MAELEFSSDKYFGLVAKSSLGFIESSEYQKIIDILFDCYRRGGTVFTMGCGGSASTATHFAADLAKTTMVDDKPGFNGGAIKEMADASIVIPINSEPYGTPVIEAMHVVLHHSIIFDLKKRIKKY